MAIASTYTNNGKEEMFGNQNRKTHRKPLAYKEEHNCEEQKSSTEYN